MCYGILAHIFLAGTRYAGDKYAEREEKLKPLKLAQQKREESLKPLRRDADDAIRVMKAHLSAVYKLEGELELRETEQRLYPDSLEKQGTADQARSNLATAREGSFEAAALAEELSRKLRKEVRAGEQEDAEMKARLLGGDLSRLVPVEEKESGSNVECPCGSGRRYKNCCGVVK